MLNQLDVSTVATCLKDWQVTLAGSEPTAAEFEYAKQKAMEVAADIRVLRQDQSINEILDVYIIKTMEHATMGPHPLTPILALMEYMLVVGIRAGVAVREVQQLRELMGKDA